MTDYTLKDITEHHFKEVRDAQKLLGKDKCTEVTSIHHLTGLPRSVIMVILRNKKALREKFKK